MNTYFQQKHDCLDAFFRALLIKERKDFVEAVKDLNPVIYHNGGEYAGINFADIESVHRALEIARTRFAHALPKARKIRDEIRAERRSGNETHRMPEPPPFVEVKLSAPDLLKRAAQHMEDRAAARDQPNGERSMKRTVEAFNALCGTSLSERDGWLFMAVLKAARATASPTGMQDDYEDGAAYFALAGESAQ